MHKLYWKLLLWKTDWNQLLSNFDKNQYFANFREFKCLCGNLIAGSYFQFRRSQEDLREGILYKKDEQPFWKEPLKCI